MIAPSRMRRPLGEHGRWRYALELAELEDGLTVVDFGCADGAFASRIARSHPASRVVACDIPYPAGTPALSEPNLDFYLLEERSPHVPLSSGTVDRIFLLDVLEHMGRDSRPAALTEMRRLLKPDGCLIVTVPHRGWLHWTDVENVRMRFPRTHRGVFVIIRGRRAYDERYGRNLLVNFSSDATEHHHFCENELVEVLRAAGFAPGERFFFGACYVVPWCMLVLLEGLRRLSRQRLGWLERLMTNTRAVSIDARPPRALAESLAIAAWGAVPPTTSAEGLCG